MAPYRWSSTYWVSETDESASALASSHPHPPNVLVSSPTKVFVTTVERRYRLAECDPRVHFALSCGARSCPPIRAYQPRRIDEELDLAPKLPGRDRGA